MRPSNSINVDIDWYLITIKVQCYNCKQSNLLTTNWNEQHVASVQMECKLQSKKGICQRKLWSITRLIIIIGKMPKKGQWKESTTFFTHFPSLLIYYFDLLLPSNPLVLQLSITCNFTWSKLSTIYIRLLI